MATWRVSFVLLAGSLGIACTAPKPILLRWDANSAEVGFTGNVDSATRVAKQHCAQYERVPRYLDNAESVAFFDCVRP